MDRRERYDNDTALTRAALRGWQAGLWTAMPAIVQAFHDAPPRVDAQIAIQAQVQQPDGTWIDTTISLCVDCPVLFPGGGGFTHTFPIAANDEGLLIFAARCIDAWWQSGGVQKQAEIRLHDLSDGFFLPTGGMSKPNAPAATSTTATQLRSKDGSTYVEITGGKIVNVVAPDGVNFTGPVTFNGQVNFLAQVNGQVGGGGTVDFGAAVVKSAATAQLGDVQTGTLASVDAHIHSDPQGGTSGPPENP